MRNATQLTTTQQHIFVCENICIYDISHLTFLTMRNATQLTTTQQHILLSEDLYVFMIYLT